jgi:uncharacterized protein YbjT (DUF2867 family)
MTILVLGSTGTNGSLVANILLDAGATVRLGVRKMDDERIASYKSQGAEVVAFDFDDLKTLAPALAGAESVVMITPLAETFAHYVTDVLDAIKNDEASTVKYIVKLSAIGSGGPNPLDLKVQEEHSLSDAALEASGLSYTIVRPNFFMSNPLGLQGASIHDPGQRAFYGTSDGKSISYVSPNDIADVMAAAALDPTKHNGKIYTLTGPESLTEAQVAEKIAAHVDHEVKYVDLTSQAYQESLTSNGMPAWLIDNLVKLEKLKGLGYCAEVSPDAEDAIGRKPESFDAFLEGQSK